MADDEIAALRAELDAMRAELRAVTDRQEILDCIHRFSKGLDRLDRELIVSAYHEDGVDHHGAFYGGPEEFATWVDGLLRPEWDCSVHFLDVNNLEIDGDEAHSETYVLFTQRRVDGDGIDFGGARYLDRHTRRDGRWRIAARKLIIEWSSRTPSMVFADVAEYERGSRDRDDPSFMRPLELTPPAAA